MGRVGVAGVENVAGANVGTGVARGGAADGIVPSNECLITCNRFKLSRVGVRQTASYLLPCFRHILDQRPIDVADGPIALIFTPARELCIQVSYSWEACSSAPVAANSEQQSVAAMQDGDDWFKLALPDWRLAAALACSSRA